MISSIAVVGVITVTVGVVTSVVPAPKPAQIGVPDPFRHHHVVITLPAKPASYLGAYANGVPRTYVPIESFAAQTGVQPNVALYYIGFNEPFHTDFALQAAMHHAVPLVQIDPTNVSLTAIADGVYDTYLETFANAVASYGARTGQGVIIGFGHEPNGRWYPWGLGHVAPSLWVAAWRHIVDVFRQQGADDVTWLWTVNIIDLRHNRIPDPAPWWPGSSYVTWVGIDGYYYKPSWSFAPLFGPTIKAVRSVTRDPILISETGAGPVSGQAAKVADLFAGIRGYGLLGFVWFDAHKVQDWRLSGAPVIAAFRRGAETYKRPAA